MIDINRLPLDRIEPAPDGGLRIGATVRNSDLAHHPTVVRDYAVLSQAILSGASAQLRNMATTAGNLLQRTRCMYFRDTAMPCNKREPGRAARRSPAAIACSRSSARASSASRPIPRTCAWLWRRSRPPCTCRGRRARARCRSATSTCCRAPRRSARPCSSPGDLITHVTLPPPEAGSRQHYLKLRDRVSYEFALASAAVVLSIADGRVTRARVALGRRRHQAVAVARGGGRARRARPPRRDVPQRGGGGAARRPAAERERVQGRAGQALRRPRAAHGDRVGQRGGADYGDDETSRDRPRHAAGGRPGEGDGTAQYTSDLHFPGHALRGAGAATIANGRVDALDTAAAEMPARRARDPPPADHRPDLPVDGGAGLRGHLRGAASPFEDDVVRYYGQYVALAVADTFEAATAAAAAVRVQYRAERPNVDPHLTADDDPPVIAATFGSAGARSEPARRRRPRVRERAGEARRDLRHAPGDPQPHRAARDDGDLGRAVVAHGVRLDAGRGERAERHRADVRAAEGDRPRDLAVPRLGLRRQAVSRGRTVALAAAAARQLGKPVKLVLSRKMMFETWVTAPTPSSACGSAPRRRASCVSLAHDYLYHAVDARRRITRTAAR